MTPTNTKLLRRSAAKITTPAKSASEPREEAAKKAFHVLFMQTLGGKVYLINYPAGTDIIAEQNKMNRKFDRLVKIIRKFNKDFPKAIKAWKLSKIRQVFIADLIDETKPIKVPKLILQTPEETKKDKALYKFLRSRKGKEALREAIKKSESKKDKIPLATLP